MSTQYTIYNITKKITLNYPKSAAMGFCSKGPKNEFETAMVKEPSVFEPLKFYCIPKLSLLSLLTWSTVYAYYIQQYMYITLWMGSIGMHRVSHRRHYIKTILQRIVRQDI